MREDSARGTVCVVGAGTMGWGIAQVFAAGGYTVELCDREIAYAQRGKSAMEAAVLRQVERGKLEESGARALLDRVVPRLPGEVSAGCVLAIEAVYESLDAKGEVLRQLDERLDSDALIATNTSSLSITELANQLRDPSRLVGMHFFNPAPVMDLVEVIGGGNTREDVIGRVTALAEEVGKTPVRVNEAPGFVVNRLLIPMINEAVALVAEGVASAPDIDCAMQLGASFRQGPLQVGDLVGLDVCLAIMEVLHRETGDDKYRPHPLLRKMVRAGKLGRKSGEGFYTY